MGSFFIIIIKIAIVIIISPPLSSLVLYSAICANRQCQNSRSQLHMRMTKRTHIPRSANAIFPLVGVWLLLLQEDPTNISILFCFSQCHPHCCMTLPALVRFLLHPALEDYFPSPPLGGGWGRSQESSLLSAHFNNSLDLKNSPRPVWPSPPAPARSSVWWWPAWGCGFPPASGRVAP